MTNATTTYVGAVLGALLLVLHIVYGWKRTGTIPSPWRLLVSVVAGAGLSSAVQLAMIVFKPPAGDRINVDDFRTTLVIGFFGLFGSSVYGLVDNARALSQPQARRHDSNTDSGSPDKS